jgi:hypothetical protein
MDAGLQDIVVTLAALAAAVSLVWRIGGLVRPQRQSRPGCGGCASCPSAQRTAAVNIQRQPLG